MATLIESSPNRPLDLSNPASSPQNDDHHNNGMRELVDLLSKLNPLAEEFVPHKANFHSSNDEDHKGGSVTDSNSNSNSNGSPNPFNSSANGLISSFNSGRRRKNGYNHGRRRQNGKNIKPQHEDSVKRTVYVSDIDQHVTEEQLAALFLTCGQVIDCRICGDPNSVLRFAFIEFADDQSARRALSLSGTVLGFYPVRVLPSKTAIHPVNPTFLPRSEDEREMCARTVYCTNIDKRVSQLDVRMFFEGICGEVSRLRLLGDNIHSTRIAFVEFVLAESAILALNCSGVILGSLPIRVSPSKTPVRPRMQRY